MKFKIVTGGGADVTYNEEAPGKRLVYMHLLFVYRTFNTIFKCYSSL